MIEIVKNYFVTEDGKVFNKNGLHRKTYAHPNGYEIFPYWLDGKFKTTPVHRLVAKAYIPNPENKPCVNHIDGDKMNNHVSNLEWVTYSENTIHALELGLKIPEQGEDVHNASMSNDTCRLVCEMMQNGQRNKEISEALGISNIVLKHIRQGLSWKHISKDYDIPRKPCSLSDDTAHWICKKMAEGWRNFEIVEASTNPMVNKDRVTKIRNRKIHKNVSDLYDF